MKALGPFDDRPWPEKLSARVTTAGSDPQVHGYAVESDLARHYSFAESMLLALTGELPSEGIAAGLEVVFHFLAPVPVSEAPTHAAVLARICGARASGAMGTGAVVLTEQARFLLEHHQAWLAWLDAPSAEIPGEAQARDASDRASGERLRVALARTKLVVPALARDISRDAALLATLHACGLTSSEQMEVAIVTARLPFVMAEALATPRQSFLAYPVNLPAFNYEDRR